MTEIPVTVDQLLYKLEVILYKLGHYIQHSGIYHSDDVIDYLSEVITRLRQLERHGKLARTLLVNSPTSDKSIQELDQWAQTTLITVDQVKMYINTLFDQYGIECHL